MIPPSRVVQRESTSLLSSHHPPTNKAITFIHQHYGDGIDVEAVAKHAGLSRHQLNKVFKQYVGEPISRYLLRIQINAACERLAETDDKIQGLAFELGFGSAAYFSTVFHKETGLTPAEFRHRARIRNHKFAVH
jgi:two-component system response regulator YesN